MLKLATVFSGIGAIESALKYLGIDYNLVFACDNGERDISDSYKKIDELIKDKDDSAIQDIVNGFYLKTGKPNLVKETYFENYEIDESQWYEDIKYVNGGKYTNQIDLYVGGSPCQSFSVNGKRAGLDDVRGTLFYEFARIINESKPKSFIYENVRGMLNHNNGKTWKAVKEVFMSLDYDVFIQQVNGKESPILNAKDFGIPQNRERLYIVGIKRGIAKEHFQFPNKIDLQLCVSDFLETSVASKYYLGQKGFEFVTTHPSRARVGNSIMGCQKANQQFNWNGDFIFEELSSIIDRPDIIAKAYVGTWNGRKGVVRKFTPRECLRLMGYHDSFIINRKDEVMYRQAGNSIVVNVLMELVKQIIKTGIFDEEIKTSNIV